MIKTNNQLSITFLFLLFLLYVPTTSSAEESSNVCIDCHQKLKRPMREPVEKWFVSVHKKAGITCVDCHGGNPTSIKLAMEEESGFIGVPNKEDVPDLCGGCHSDIQRMRKFNIRTDQLAAYKTSVHGLKLLKDEDDNVAACVDCHNSHDVLSKNDPKSPVYRFNVPQTCDGCHGDEELMEAYDIPINQYELYKNSVHGKKLFEEQNLRVPTCPDCHGIHGAAPPGVKEISFVCSNCHGIIAEYYKEGPHWAAYSLKGKPHCVSCHSNHDIQKPGIEKFSGKSERDCGGCHKDYSKEFKLALSIKDKIMNAQKSVTEVEGLLVRLKNTRGGSFETSAIENVIDKANTKMIETIPITHSLSLKKISGKLEEVVSISTSVKENLNSKFVDLKNRKIVLAVSWVFVLIVVYLLRKLQKSVPH